MKFIPMGFDHIVLYVRDQAVSKEFYEGVLGCTVAKINPSVPIIHLRFGEQLDLHHVEDEFAEIFAALDAPFFQHRECHRPELLQRVFTNAGQQFLTRNVPDFAFPRSADGFPGVIEGFPQKEVGVAVIARVFGQYGFNEFLEIGSLHVMEIFPDRLTPSVGAPCDTPSLPTRPATEQ